MLGKLGLKWPVLLVKGSHKKKVPTGGGGEGGADRRGRMSQPAYLEIIWDG
jgi:hypothetical protein